MAEYLSLHVLLSYIDEPNRSCLARMYHGNEHRLRAAPGSRKKHQAWPGGYLAHVVETMNIGMVLFDAFGNLRPLPFSLSSVFLVLFLHDIEKPWVYVPGDDGRAVSLESKESRMAFRHRIIEEYGVILTEDEWNALTYVEGEGKDHDPETRVMGRLAALCHLADTASARLWFDMPTESDSW